MLRRPLIEFHPCYYRVLSISRFIALVSFISLVTPVYANAERAIQSNDAHVMTLDSVKQALDKFTAPEEKLEYLQQAQQHHSWNPIDNAHIFNLIAIEQEALDKLDDAVESYSLAIQSAEQVATSDILVISYIERSFIKYLQVNDKERYCPDREYALELARAIDSPIVLSKALTQSAFCYTDTQVFEQGLQRLEEALLIAKKHHFPPNKQAMIYNSTGAIYRSNGLHKYAYEYFNEAYRLWSEVDDIQDMFNMLHNLVGEAIKMSDWEAAEIHVVGLFDLAKRHPEFNDFLFFAYFNAGRLSYYNNDHELAIERLQNAKQLSSTTNEQYFIGLMYAYLALAHMQQEQPELAYEAADVFINSNTFTASSSFLKTSIMALKQFSEQEYLSSFNLLMSSLNHERLTYASIMDKDVIYSSLEHNSKVAEYEIQILENQLAINLLKLKSETDKQQISQLTLIVTSLIIVVLLVATAFLIQSRRFFKRRSQTDYLTGISNRRYTMEQGNRLFSLALKRAEPLAVIIFDIDKFKMINDTYGHHIGDLTIKAAARKARNWVKKTDVLGRIGGEEFLLILPNTNIDQAVEVAERLRNSIEQQTFTFDHVEVKFTISLGVTVSQLSEVDGVVIEHSEQDELAEQDLGTEESLDSLSKMIKRADAGMYKAKQNGRNQTFSM